MEPIHYLRALRQWWLVILGLTVLGFVAALAFTSTPSPEFTATHTLVLDGTNSDPVTLSRAAFLATTGQVQAQANVELGLPKPSVEAVADTDLNGVQLSATAGTPERAIKVADAYAAKLDAFLQQQAASAYTTSITAAQNDVNAARLVVLAAGANPSDSIQSTLDSAVTKLQNLQAQGTPTSGFTTLGTTAVASTGGGSSRTTRALIGGLLGLFLGIVLALVLARFDTRIRMRETAEAAFGAPVVAEIPLLPRKMRNRHAIVTSADPESLSAEAYRGLRTALLVAEGADRRRESRQPRRGRGARPESVPPPKTQTVGRVIMVISPGVGEGKTTTSANLAVAFAETGRSVLLLACDLRRPELHEYFGLAARPGMTDLLAATATDRSLEHYVRGTLHQGVRIVTSGNPVEHPGELLTRGLDLLNSARQLADVVIIDTAPVLATDDASVLLPIVDDVVVVCRVGRTPSEAGRRARELLTRLSAPLVGVVLIGAQALPGARSYYRSDYRSHPRPSADPGADSAGSPEETSVRELGADAPTESGTGLASPTTNGVHTAGSDPVKSDPIRKPS